MKVRVRYSGFHCAGVDRVVARFFRLEGIFLKLPVIKKTLYIHNFLVQLCKPDAVLSSIFLFEIGRRGVCFRVVRDIFDVNGLLALNEFPVQFDDLCV